MSHPAVFVRSGPSATVRPNVIWSPFRFLYGHCPAIPGCSDHSDRSGCISAIQTISVAVSVGSASSSSSVVFRSNPASCPAVSSVVLVVSVFVSVCPCLFGPSDRSSEMVRNCLAYVTIYVTIYVIIWSRLSILCLFSHFVFLSLCSSCLSGLFW